MNAPPAASTSWVLRLDGADARALAWIARRRPPSLTRVMRTFTRSPDTPLVVGGLALALLIHPVRATVVVATATIAAAILFSVVKRICRRTRPAAAHAVLPVPDRFSMPSGHTTIAWTIALTLSVQAPAVAALACTWALVISLSRVILGVHYPFDVVAGAALGTAAAAATIVSAGLLFPVL